MVSVFTFELPLSPSSFLFPLLCPRIRPNSQALIYWSVSDLKNWFPSIDYNDLSYLFCVNLPYINLSFYYTKKLIILASGSVFNLKSFERLHQFGHVNIHHSTALCHSILSINHSALHLIVRRFPKHLSLQITRF